MNANSDLRLAILGCGAVTELGHLPAIRELTNARATVLIDTNAARRERLANAFEVAHTSADVSTCYDRFDAAIIALPHALHEPASVDLLKRGKSVLVEKPMAMTVAQCDAMVAAAQASGAVLAVGLVRRFMRSVRFARALIEDGTLGAIEGFDIREGGIYNWPVASDFFFRKEAAGGGVLMDTGAHTLDTLLYLLGDFAEVAYFDDAEGGVEANCLLETRMQNGTSGVVELSRTRQLRNTAIIRGQRAVLELAVGSNNLKLSLPNRSYVLAGAVNDLAAGDESQDYLQIMTAQLADFADAIAKQHPAAADGHAGRASIRLIETCYSNRKPLVMPWDHPGLGAVG
jgi:predicted dehydrogenase